MKADIQRSFDFSKDTNLSVVYEWHFIEQDPFDPFVVWGKIYPNDPPVNIERFIENCRQNDVSLEICNETNTILCLSHKRKNAIRARNFIVNHPYVERAFFKANDRVFTGIGEENEGLRSICYSLSGFWEIPEKELPQSDLSVKRYWQDAIKWVLNNMNFEPDLRYYYPNLTDTVLFAFNCNNLPPFFPRFK